MMSDILAIRRIEHEMALVRSMVIRHVNGLETDKLLKDLLTQHEAYCKRREAEMKNEYFAPRGTEHQA